MNREKRLADHPLSPVFPEQSIRADWAASRRSEHSMLASTAAPFIPEKGPAFTLTESLVPGRVPAVGPSF